MMIEIGRICVKIAGRDAGLRCAVVDDLGKGIVLIDGQTRRRKCNIRHLEPLDQKIKIGKNASHDEVAKEFKKLKLEITEKKAKKKKTEKPLRQRKKKQRTEEAAKEPKTEKKAEKKIQPKEKAEKTTKKKGFK